MKAFTNLSFSIFDIVHIAGGRYARFPLSCGASFCRIPISTRSFRALIPSLVLVGMFSNVPIKLSHTFFSTCMTPRQCLTSKNSQYGSSQNMDFFFQIFFGGALAHFPKITSRLSTRLKTLFPSNGRRATPSSFFPLNTFFCLRYG